MRHHRVRVLQSRRPSSAVGLGMGYSQSLKREYRQVRLKLPLSYDTSRHENWKKSIEEELSKAS